MNESLMTGIIILVCWTGTVIFALVGGYALGGRDEARRQMHEMERMKRRQEQ